jgi:hypothetical protein
MLPAAGPFGPSITTRIIEMARSEFEAVIVDAGPVSPSKLGFDPGVPVLVVQPTDVGLVRTARLVADWDGPTPYVVVNQVGPADEPAALRRVRAATGLEPATMIGELDMEGAGRAPSPCMIEALEMVALDLFLADQRSAAL